MKNIISSALLLFCLSTGISQTITTVTNANSLFAVVFQETVTVDLSGTQFSRALIGRATTDTEDEWTYTQWTMIDSYNQFLRPGTGGQFSEEVFTNTYSLPLYGFGFIISQNPEFWAQSDLDWQSLIPTALSIETLNYTNILCADWPNWSKQTTQSTWQGGDVWCDFDSTGTPRISEGARPVDFDKWLQDGSINPNYVDPLAPLKTNHGKKHLNSK